MEIQKFTKNSISKYTGEVIRSDLSVRPAGPDDLGVINAIVTGAIATWGLSQRVNRLAERSLTYTTFDLAFMRAALGENKAGIEIAATLWEPEKSGSGNHSSVLLHGIYVLPEYQRCGVGANMVEHVANIVKKDGFDGITVKAWRDAEEFFMKLGFYHPQKNGRDRLYPLHLWKPV